MDDTDRSDETEALETSFGAVFFLDVFESLSELFVLDDDFFLVFSLIVLILLVDAVRLLRWQE